MRIDRQKLSKAGKLERLRLADYLGIGCPCVECIVREMDRLELKDATAKRKKDKSNK